MTPERYQQVMEVFHAASELEGTERDAFLDRICASDDEVRREVDSLLRHGNSSQGLLDRPAWVVPDVIGAGTRVGTYIIEELLGAGATGEVFRALDTKLNRPVSVKVLYDELADAAARRRFQREAQLASSLNHPHILTVHDAGEFEGRQYLVTEYVDEGTLRDWVKKDRRSWQEIVELMAGVADGMACAHQAGVLHRDVKPENILVGTNGYAKLGDFGLAKLVESSNSNDPTRTLLGTQTRPGLIMGTIAYMSPEQASGKPIDPRSDIFSFGVVLYEMLAGKSPFQGGTDLETLQRIIHAAPEQLEADVPAQLRAVVEKALEKDPGDRYQTMRDLMVDLRRLIRSSGDKTAPMEGHGWRLSKYWIAAVTLVVAGLVVWKFFPIAADTSGIRSIAVLPLENLSGDPGQEYFSAGITEALISTLAQIRPLNVISRTSIMRYKETKKPLREIGRELGADGILEGSVQRVGKRVRISARLFRAATDSQLWAQDYERDVGDVLSLEVAIAQSIASRIRIELTADETRRLVGRRINPEAQEAYFRGRYYSWNFNDRDQAESIRNFEEAVRLQPDFAAAYAGMAVGWETRVILGFVPFDEGDGPAHAAAIKAGQLDPNLPDVHDALGVVCYGFDWAWTRCEKEFRRAIELDSNYVDARNDYSYFLIIQGRLPEAIAQIERAAALDPLNPGVQITFGLALARSRRYSEATQHFNRVLELEPENPIARRNLTTVAEYSGDFEMASRLLGQQLRSRGGDIMQVPQAGRIFAKQGRQADAQRVLANVTKPGSQVSAMQVASLYFALGDKDRGFKWLTQAFDRREVVVLLKTDPLFDSVHSDPRFQALLRRLGVPD